jgi:hypothetical protein
MKVHVFHLPCATVRIQSEGLTTRNSDIDLHYSDTDNALNILWVVKKIVYFGETSRILFRIPETVSSIPDLKAGYLGWNISQVSSAHPGKYWENSLK